MTLRAPAIPTPPRADGEDAATGVRAELRALHEYHLDLIPCRHKLDQNESPFEPPRRLKERVAHALAEAPWARYPDFHADRLRQALGALHQWPWHGVLVGNGSNELLSLTLDAVVAKGGEVLGAEPTFSLYRTMIVKSGGRPRFLPPRRDLRLPMRQLCAAAAETPRAPVVLCSPNNPTGDVAGEAELVSLLEATTAPVLLDNAYGDFCDVDYTPLLARYRRLVVFRTLSKAWALGGLRVGYLLADPQFVQDLIKVKLPYNLGRAGSLAAEAVLHARPAMSRRLTVIRGRRRQWADTLQRQGLEVVPSAANFLLVRCGAGDEGMVRASRLFRGLAQRGIRVRDVGSYPGLAGCLRVSVGDGRSLRAFERACREISGEEGR